MTAYIQDQNNAEDIANDSTVLNATNYGNLTYKVDEMQFLMNELHKYKHTTIIASTKDSWASKSWTGLDNGVLSEDNTNYIMNGKSLKLTGDANEDGIHLEKVMDLTTHADGYASSTDDIITLFCYVSSGDLSNITHVDLSFYTEVYGTWDNYFWDRFEVYLKPGKNIVKLKKSGFSEYGSPDWSAIRGLDIYFESPSAEVSVSIDMILLHTQEFKNFVVKTADESLNSSTSVQNDNELYVDLPQNGKFEISLYISAISASATPDIKFDWTVTGDVSFLYNRFINSVPYSASDASDANRRLEWFPYNQEAGCAIEGGSGESLYFENFIVRTLNDGGRLQLRWAQVNTSGTDITVNAGSYIKITQME
jgi:hypothetical protein